MVMGAYGVVTTPRFMEIFWPTTRVEIPDCGGFGKGLPGRKQSLLIMSFITGATIQLMEEKVVPIILSITIINRGLAQGNITAGYLKPIKLPNLESFMFQGTMLMVIRQ